MRGASMLSFSEMIFGMVGLLILLIGGVGVLGLLMLSKMRSNTRPSQPDSGDQPRSNS
jgi:hypothetical protein